MIIFWICAGIEYYVMGSFFAFHGNITSVEFDSGVHFQMWTFFSFNKFVRQHIHPGKKQNVRKHEVKS